MAILRVAAVAGAVLFAGLFAIAGPGCGGTSCKVPADCQNSDEAKELGRCAPQEAICFHGECRVGCTDTCTALEQEVRPCPGGSICTESKSRPNPASGRNPTSTCTRAAIACTSADDCPLVIPPTATASGAWACNEGVCRFPGFRLAYED